MGAVKRCRYVDWFVRLSPYKPINKIIYRLLLYPLLEDFEIGGDLCVIMRVNLLLGTVTAGPFCEADGSFF
jgi:hypothetical protein